MSTYICKQFNTFNGCGKCKINLNDKNHIRQLNIINITDIVDILFKFCSKQTSRQLIIAKSTVSCRGEVVIYDISNKTSRCIYANRIECRKFVDTWYKYHKSKLLECLLIVYLSQVNNILNTVGTSKELITKASILDDCFNKLFPSNIATNVDNNT